MQIKMFNSAADDEPFDDHVPIPDLDDAIVMACPVRSLGVWCPAQGKTLDWSMPLERELLKVLTSTPKDLFSVAIDLGFGCQGGIDPGIELIRRQIERMTLLGLVEIVEVPQLYRPPLTHFKRGSAAP